MDMQKVFLIGNLGADAEERTTAEGKRVLNFRMAINQGEKYPTLWPRVAVWEAPEWMAGALLKGVKVHVEGRLQPDENGNPRVYQTKDGGSASSYEITANQVIVLSGGNGQASKPEANTEIPF